MHKQQIQWRETPDTTFGNDTLWFHAPEGVRVFANWKEGCGRRPSSRTARVRL